MRTKITILLFISCVSLCAGAGNIPSLHKLCIARIIENSERADKAVTASNHNGRQDVATEIAACFINKTLVHAVSMKSQILTGHTGSVYSLAYSPDGTMLASGSDDMAVRLWNGITGELIKRLTGHTDWVCSLAYSPDGTMLASGSGDRTVRLWNGITGELLKTLSGHTDWVCCLAYSPDGTTLASGSGDKTVRLWNSNTGELIKRLTGNTGDVTSLAYSPDGTTLASGSLDNTVRLWNGITGELVKRLTGHTYGVTSLAYSPNGTTLASGSLDNTVRLWRDYMQDLLNITDPDEPALLFFLFKAAQAWSIGCTYLRATQDEQDMYNALIKRFPYLQDPRLFDAAVLQPAQNSMPTCSSN